MNSAIIMLIMCAVCALACGVMAIIEYFERR